MNVGVTGPVEATAPDARTSSNAAPGRKRERVDMGPPCFVVAALANQSSRATRVRRCVAPWVRSSIQHLDRAPGLVTRRRRAQRGGAEVRRRDLPEARAAIGGVAAEADGVAGAAVGE